jgi:hypothetical protein
MGVGISGAAPGAIVRNSPNAGWLWLGNSFSSANGGGVTGPGGLFVGLDEMRFDYGRAFASADGGMNHFTPQNPVPKPLPDVEHEFKGQRLVDFNSAYGKAIEALKKPECAKYIGADPEKGIDPAKILEHIKQQGKLLDGGPHDKYAAYTYGGGTESVITFYNDFFDPYIGSNISGVSMQRFLDAETARALLILHEVRHAVTDIGHPTDWFGNLKQDVLNSNEDFNRNIFLNCFGVKMASK